MQVFTKSVHLTGQIYLSYIASQSLGIGKSIAEPGSFVDLDTHVHR